MCISKAQTNLKVLQECGKLDIQSEGRANTSTRHVTCVRSAADLQISLALAMSQALPKKSSNPTESIGVYDSALH